MVEAHSRDTNVDLFLLLKDERLPNVDSNSEDLDITAPPLGFVHSKFGPMYMSRPPYRQQKQGIQPRSCNFLGFGGAERLPDNKEIATMMVGKYPTYEEGLETFRTTAETKGFAFTRPFAIGYYKDIPCVSWRGRMVGFFDPIKNSLWMHPKYQVKPIVEALKPRLTIENL